ncbi:MAG TPA: hypothetical protein VKW76_07265 [Candidatus Binatia bacterium]|nr:hypothetical protein [Candidatus Binatia bacterium]
MDDPGIPPCPAGTTRVVYRLDQPFPPDGTMSTAVIHSTLDSPCAGAQKTVGMTGYMIGCWTQPRPDGCRTVEFLNNGTLCLHLAAAPLGCGGAACASRSVEQVAISNAGAADHLVCAPPDPTMSCRSGRPNGQEKFRLWFGGLCSTMDLDGSGSTADACVTQWGATLWGYSTVGQRGAHPDPGWYDWQSGAFKVSTVAGRPQCGLLGDCLGQDARQAPWTITLVATPVVGAVVPCPPGAASACDPAVCFR